MLLSCYKNCVGVAIIVLDQEMKNKKTKLNKQK